MRLRRLPWLTACLLLLIGGSSLFAADVSPGWGGWWLPPDRSEHGPAIDSLFTWIFWITMVAFVGVELLLFVFLFKYRSRGDNHKAKFTHGNTRLEMAWTLIPAVILALLALFSKKVWDNYRYSPAGDDPNRAKILVIGEQFKWNVIYPGPDGKFGKYLIYPHPSDAKWPNNPDGTPFIYQGVAGPASLPYEKSLDMIKSYIASENPLGKVFDDPDGKDDDWTKFPGREIYVPAHRPVEVQLSSKDVIHDFFLPNFRVKLDAVPGMRGLLYFTATMTSKQREEASHRKYTVDELTKDLQADRRAEYRVIISEAEHTEGAEDYKPQRGPRFWRYKDAKGATLIRDGGGITLDNLAKLNEAGIKEMYAVQPGSWDLVCAELCGQGHNTMRGTLVVVDNDEYKQKFETAKAQTASAQ